jgi:hypothetical protein
MGSERAARPDALVARVASTLTDTQLYAIRWMGRWAEMTPFDIRPIPHDAQTQMRELEKAGICSGVPRVLYDLGIRIRAHIESAQP